MTRAWKARMLPLHHTRINDNHKVYLPDCQVSLRGLEPPRINSLEPKPSASTNSATATNRPTRTRTWDNRLEGGGYIHLTMGPLVVPIAASPEPLRGLPQLITLFRCHQHNHHTGLQ